MYTYHEPFIGLLISRKEMDEFDKSIYYILFEYDLSHANQIGTPILEEYLTDMGIESKNISVEVTEYLNLFFTWMEDFNNLFNLKRYYHGSAMTPIALISKDSKKLNTSYHQSYSLKIEDLQNFINLANELKKICNSTMPKKLFDFLDKKDYFEIHYINCSS